MCQQFQPPLKTTLFRPKNKNHSVRKKNIFIAKNHNFHEKNSRSRNKNKFKVESFHLAPSRALNFVQTKPCPLYLSRESPENAPYLHYFRCWNSRSEKKFLLCRPSKMSVHHFPHSSPTILSHAIFCSALFSRGFWVLWNLGA